MKRLVYYLALACFAVGLLWGQNALAKAPDIILPGNYIFYAVNAGVDKVLVNDANGTDGDTLVIDDKDSQLPHKFYIEPYGNGGFFLIRLGHTGLYLDTDCCKTDAGYMQVMCRPYTGQKSQLWYARTIMQVQTKKLVPKRVRIYNAISSTDNHYDLRYIKGKAVLCSEYEVNKAYVWDLANLEE